MASTKEEEADSLFPFGPAPYLIKLSTAKFPWNKTDKTPTFTGITPHVTILTMLETIRKSQDGMSYEFFGDIIA